MKKALIWAAAISSVAGAAHADELSDLKAQSEQLKQQNQLLISRIDQLEQRQDKLEAQPVAAQPAAAPGPSFPADDGSLTYHGVTLYGGVDIGVAYQSAGTPLNDEFGPGLEYFLSKNSNRSLISLAPNALSYSNVGLKGIEEIVPGLSALFNFQTSFVPTSGQLSNGSGSQAENNGVALNKQTSNGDSSRAGQTFNAAAYFGLTSPTYGTITVGRQNSLNGDLVIAYDPQGGSNAFSLIGFQGGTAGGGLTEDARLDGSAKYLVSLGPVRFGTLYQLKGFGNVSTQSAYEFDIGTDYDGLSVDFVYSQVYDAITTSVLTAAQTLAEPAESLAATVSDNTSQFFAARYELDEYKFYGGFERIQFDNAQSPISAGTSGLGGFDLSVVNNTAFTENKVLEISFGGVKYAFTPKLTLTGAYYHEFQNSFAVKPCSSAKSSSCSGDEDAVSFVADYQLTRRFDVYAGAEYSQADRGLASGFLHDSTIDPTVGARFRF